MAVKTTPRKNGVSVERTSYLREQMKYPLTKDDLIPMVREIAKLLIALEEDIACLPGLAEQVGNLNTLIVSLSLEAGKHKDDGLSDDERRKKAIAAAKATLELYGQGKDPEPAFLSWPYWKKNIMPSIVSWATLAVIGFVLYGIWLAFLAKLAGE